MSIDAIVIFVSTCPCCKREQPQEAFTVADLLRLLNGGYPIEGYCLDCDEFWPISLQKRIELGEVVAVACKLSRTPATPQNVRGID